MRGSARALLVAAWLIISQAVGWALAAQPAAPATPSPAAAEVTPYTGVLPGPPLDQDEVNQHNARVEIAASNLDLDFRHWSIAFNKSSFEWHFLSTKIIF